MRLLLDTHTFLWFVLNDRKIKGDKTRKSRILSPVLEIVVSWRTSSPALAPSRARDPS
jgi:PIN domain nuclease of toxin-antitoxin system